MSHLDDPAVIEKASQARGGERFRQLWAGDASAYTSRSEADFALASKLAFWCGPDADRIERLMRQSGLVRPKWDRRDYLSRTIANALKDRTEFYSPERKGTGCEHSANRVLCPNSCVQEETTIRTNWDKSVYMRKVRTRYANNPWDCPKAFGAAGREGFSPCLICATCRKRTCPICGDYWKLQTYRRFGYHVFAYDGQLYTDGVPDLDWSATVKDMRRRAKKLGVPLRYVAIRNEDDMLTVISSVPMLAEIARPIERTEALDLLEDAVDTALMGPRPFNSCREWKPLDKPEVERAPGGCSPAAFCATCEAWGAGTEGGRRFIKCDVADLFLREDGTLDEIAEIDFWHEGWLRDEVGNTEAHAFHVRAAKERQRIASTTPPRAMGTCCHPPAQVRASPPTFDGYVNRQCGACGQWLTCRKAGTT